MTADLNNGFTTSTDYGSMMEDAADTLMDNGLFSLLGGLGGYIGQSAGRAIGLGIGALVGGPPGAFLGAGVGQWLGGGAGVAIGATAGNVQSGR